MSTSAHGSGNPMAGLADATRLTEIRQRLLFLLGGLVVYRIGTFIPIPGIDPIALARFFQQQEGTILGLFNMFSGGALSRLSIFALGVMPYISSSIIIQMVAVVYPPWAEWRKEGEAGRRRVTQITRYATVVLALFQGLGASYAFQNQGVVLTPGPFFLLTATVTLTTGTLFLMWLGEQITERGIGNGISLLIFAGIVAGLPSAVVRTLQMSSQGELSPLRVLAILLLVLGVTAFVVFVERGQRRITVNYARRQGGSRAYMNQSSHLPLKLNMSGVIPAIFASSLIMFPATASTWFASGTDIRWLQQITAALSPGEPLYEILYATLIIVFAFFYTALVFNSGETAENLKKSGALVPGIRPGRATAEYIDAVLTRLTGAGAVYLVLVCLVPTFLQQSWHVPFYFGGTSLLIVVVVVMDFTAQVQAHLVSHQYESLLKKANLKGYGRGGAGR